MIKTLGFGFIFATMSALGVQAQIASDNASQPAYQDGRTAGDNW
jgi:hypothetical protein